MPRILIGNVKGPQGEKGDTGATGAPGEAASVRVGAVETVAYGQPAAVTNTGTDYDAVLNFRIPQGAPGQAPTGMGNLLLDSITDSTAEYPVIAVDERGTTVFGKIKKFLNDLLSDINSINTNGLFKSNLVNGFTQTTSGVNALDAAAGKSLNDSLSNTINSLPKCTSWGYFNFRDYTWTRSGQGMYYANVPLSTFFPNITFNNIYGIKIVNFASLRATDWFIPYIRNNTEIACMCPVNSWNADNSGFTFELIYN